jgi:virginiamycin B lyase
MHAGAGGGIGRITPAGVPRSFPRPPNAQASIPQDLVAGPDGNLWLAGTGDIRRITPAGLATQRSRRGAAAIVLGPDRNLWFINSSAVSRMTPAGAITDFPAGLRPRDLPMDLASGPDRSLWYTSAGPVPAIRRMTPTGVVTELPPDPTAFPNGIAAGPDGNMWFTDPGSGSIGRISPDGALTLFPSGLRLGADPYGITAGPDGRMWFTTTRGRPTIGAMGTGAPPARVSAPRIDGVRRVGSRLTCRGDRWASWAGLQPRAPMAGGRYRGRPDGDVVVGRPTAVYTPVARDAGHRISCTSTVTYPLLAVTVSATSKPAMIRPGTTGAR